MTSNGKVPGIFQSLEIVLLRWREVSDVMEDLTENETIDLQTDEMSIGLDWQMMEWSDLNVRKWNKDMGITHNNAMVWFGHSDSRISGMERNGDTVLQWRSSPSKKILNQ